LEDSVDEMLGASVGQPSSDKVGDVIIDEELPRAAPMPILARVAADKYFFLLAAAQLVKCVTRLPCDGLPPLELSGFTPEASQLLKDLRNFEEHWEQSAGPSITRVQRSIPDIAPGRLQYNNKHIWLEGMPLSGIVDWVSQVEQRLIEIGRVEEPLPD
jgi:hypothetical protein